MCRTFARGIYPIGKPVWPAPGSVEAGLVLWVRDSQTKSLDAGKDLIGRLRPDEGCRVGIVGGEIFAYRLLELLRGAVRAAADLLLGQGGKPPLHLIQPRRRSGG